MAGYGRDMEFIILDRTGLDGNSVCTAGACGFCIDLMRFSGIPRRLLNSAVGFVLSLVNFSGVCLLVGLIRETLRAMLAIALGSLKISSDIQALKR